MPKNQGQGHPSSSHRVSRRGFLGSVSAGVVGAAVAGSARAAPASPVAEDGELVKATLLINGRPFQVQIEPRMSLLHVLRDELGLTGTKLGCDRGECGACTVLLDGVARYSCMTLALEAEGHEITTIEGLMEGEELGPVQRAFAEEDAFQCGYCTPGQVMAAEGLLRKNPNPGLDEIRESMSGNLCRCGAYGHVFKAVRRAADSRNQGGAA